MLVALPSEHVSVSLHFLLQQCVCHRPGNCDNERSSSLFESLPTLCSKRVKQKDAIKSATIVKGTSFQSQLRTKIHIKMEKLLLVWVKEKVLAEDSVGGYAVICEKERNFYRVGTD